MSTPRQPAPGYPQYGPPARPRLDDLMDRMRAHDGAPWGWRPVVLPCAALLVLIVIGRVVGQLVIPHSFAAAMAETVVPNSVLYGALVLTVYLAGRDLARRYAGWGWTFGLQRPRAVDAAWTAAGVGMVLVSRLFVLVVANALTGGKAAEQSQNVTVHSHSPAVYVVLGVLAVVIAPVVEELVFRGLLLRTFMRSWGFWPAALASSAIFAVFHVYEVATLIGAATLASVIFCLGLTNCLLVRWSGRLTAGIAVHMLFNALAVIVLAVRNT